MRKVHGPVVAALDIGTTKICALQAQFDKKTKRLKPLGLGRVQAEGISGAKVTNLDKLADSITAAVESFQNQAGMRFPSKVYVGVAGNHCESENKEVRVEIKSPARGIRPAEVERAIRRVREEYAVKPPNKSLLHIIIQGYRIGNDEMLVEDPINLHAESLTVCMHLVYADRLSLTNIFKAVSLAGLEVKEVVLESYASSLAVLTPSERQNGVILLDMGGGTTDIAVFDKGSLVFTGVIPFAGDSITNDIAKVCHVTEKDAETLKRKCELGTHSNRDQLVHVPNVYTGREEPIRLEDIEEAVNARVEEILCDARDLLRKHEIFSTYCPGGLVLTGGTAQLAGIDRVAQRVFESAVGLYWPQRFSVQVKTPANGPLHIAGESLYEDPALATVCGLAYYGLSGRSVSSGVVGRSSRWAKIKSLFRQLLGES
jgi:cell division protein FtsA